jgi:2-desacetyl-2-hydroxyethyl bacteriochlorophyllide A dehydrogenase
MKAALLLGPERISIEDIEEAPLAAGDVKIQPAYTGICGTDISFYLGHRTVPYPFVLGHEVTGIVTALGAEASELRIGQRVVVEPNYPCGSCLLCRSGRGAICARKGSMGVNLPGCFSERAVAPAEFVWPLPDTVSEKDAAAIEPLTVSLHALLQSGARLGDTVAVLGCGIVGLLLIHAAVAAGVRVFAHDRFADKLEMARDLGAVIAEEGSDTAGMWQEEGVSTVFECAGVPATVELALSTAPRGSQVVLLGLSSEPASFVPMRLVREGIHVQTSMIYDHPADFKHSIDLVAAGKLSPARVVTDIFSFESVGPALERACTGKAGKILIKMM